MSDKSFTFFEIHLHDGIQVTNNAPFGKSKEVAGEELSDVVDLEDLEDLGDLEATVSSSGPSLGRFLFVVAVLVVLAIAVKKFRGGEDLSELEDLDEVATGE
jgi:hypothetical protein